MSFHSGYAAGTKYTDPSGNSIEFFPADKKIRVSCKGAANLANLPVEYEYYELIFDGTSIYTPADIEAVLKWKAAKKVLMLFTARSTPDNEPFWQRFRELKQTQPDAMEKITVYRR